MRTELTANRSTSGTLLLLATLAISACATSPRTSRSDALSGPTCTEVCIFRTSNGAILGLAALTRDIADADVIVFGELHDDAIAHRVQLQLLQELSARRGDALALSLEMFERDVQPLLNRYLSGDLSEESFLQDSRPWERYRSDYRPLVEHARERGWAVIASNTPRRIASIVSRSGVRALDSLSAEDRTLVADEVRCPRDQYYQRFVQQMQSHGGMGGDSAAAREAMDRYYEAQCIKDETMAESVLRAWRAHPQPYTIVHMNGAFHSDYRLGMVAFLQRREPALRIVVLSALPVPEPANAELNAHRNRADYMIFTRRP